VNLTHPNVVTKVGTAGQIVEGGITDESTANSDRIHISPTGNVGIGLNPPTQRFQVAAPTTTGDINTARQAHLGLDNNADYGLSLGYYSTGTMLVGVIQAWQGSPGGGLLLQPSGGNVGIGMLAPSFQLQLGADSAAKPATSSWSVVSDVRLKENVEPVMDDSLAILAALNWARYEYNGRGNTPQGLKAIGLSAQEVRAHLPEAVRSVNAKLDESDDEESELLAIDYHHILVHSARAIQQLDAEVKSLKARVGKPPS
jgi:hypothetical protein